MHKGITIAMRSSRKVATGVGGLLAWALLVTVAAPALATDEGPVSVRIKTYVNEKPDDAKVTYDWVVEHGNKQIRLYVQELTVTTGTLLPGDIDSAVDPYPVNFRLAGQDDALKTLDETAAGSQVVIDAYLELGDGTGIMMLDTVKPAAAPAKPAADAK